MVMVDQQLGQIAELQGQIAELVSGFVGSS